MSGTKEEEVKRLALSRLPSLLPWKLMSMSSYRSTALWIAIASLTAPCPACQKTLSPAIAHRIDGSHASVLTTEVAEASIEKVALRAVFEEVVVNAALGHVLVDRDGLCILAELRRELSHLCICSLLSLAAKQSVKI